MLIGITTIIAVGIILYLITSLRNASNLDRISNITNILTVINIILFLYVIVDNITKHEEQDIHELISDINTINNMYINNPTELERLFKQMYSNIPSDDKDITLKEYITGSIIIDSIIK